MADFVRYEVLRKVGLVDSNGKVVVEPIFDDIIKGNSVAFVKQGERWGILTDFDKTKYIEYAYEEVMAFKKAIWVRKYGKWGVLDYNGNILVEPMYKAIWRVGENEIVEAYDLNGAVHYVDSRGEALSNKVTLMGLLPFECGYAMAIGSEKGSNMSKYFVVREFDGCVLARSFMYKKECDEWLLDLREGYIWSIQAFKY